MSSSNDIDPNDDYQTQSDAKTLQDAQAIQADPDRHQKALEHMQGTQSNTDAAVKHAKRHFIRQTKQRMNKVFGGGDDKGASGKTPFEEAGGD